MDLNGDGLPDILSGSYMDETSGKGHFQVLWGEKGGTFRKAETLKGADGKPMPVSAQRQFCTRPTAVDWDGDGDLDIVSGNLHGTFALFLGEGKGRFSPTSEFIVTNGKPLQVENGHSDPFMIDWDGDGDLDLLSGSAGGGVYWAENSAGKGKPITLKPFSKLIDATSVPGKFRGIHWEDDEPVPASHARVWAEDVNGDGKPDLLLGDSVGLSSPVGGASKGEIEKTAKQTHETLKTLLQLGQIPHLSSAISNTNNTEARQELEKRLAKIKKKHASFMKLNPQEQTEHKRKLVEKHKQLKGKYTSMAKIRHTGRVWLFLRK